MREAALQNVEGGARRPHAVGKGQRCPGSRLLMILIIDIETFQQKRKTSWRGMMVGIDARDYQHQY